MSQSDTLLSKRFKGLLPVVVDVETSGLHVATDALLEIAIVSLQINGKGALYRDHTLSYHVEPFEGARIDPAALVINKIDPFHPLRFAIPEAEAIKNMVQHLHQLLAQSGCRRAVLVGHNPTFDLTFIQASAKRSAITSLPFHPFITLDTASLSALLFGETILAKALKRAKIEFDLNEAHSAIYDAEKTADLFCYIMNSCAAIYKNHLSIDDEYEK